MTLALWLDVSAFHFGHSRYCSRSDNRKAIIVFSTPSTPNNEPTSLSNFLFETSEIFGRLASIFTKNTIEQNVKQPPTLSNKTSKKLSIDQMKVKLKEEYQNLFWVTGS